MLHAVLGLYIRALGSIDRALLRPLQLKNEPAFGRATQPPFTHISNRCNKKYELAQDNVLDYYLTASRRPRAKTGVTGPTAFKDFRIGGVVHNETSNQCFCKIRNCVPHDFG